MKVFVVEDGEYSDYRVEGIFSTREKAETFLRELRKQEYCSGSGSIAEWELDVRLNESYGPIFEVHIDVGSGDEVNRCQRNSLRNTALATKAAFVPFGSKRQVAVGESAKSYAHALKLATEKRQAILRKAVQGHAPDKEQ